MTLLLRTELLPPFPLHSFSVAFSPTITICALSLSLSLSRVCVCVCVCVCIVSVCLCLCADQTSHMPAHKVRRVMPMAPPSRVLPVALIPGQPTEGFVHLRTAADIDAFLNVSQPTLSKIVCCVFFFVVCLFVCLLLYFYQDSDNLPGEGQLKLTSFFSLLFISFHFRFLFFFSLFPFFCC